MGLLSFALLNPQPCQAYGGLQFEQLCRLVTRCFDGVHEGKLCFGRIAWPTFEQDFSARPMEFGQIPTLSRPFDGRKLVIDDSEARIWMTGSRVRFRQQRHE